MTTIIEYTDAHAEVFRDINMEWLDRYNLTDEYDRVMLANPRETIITPGGAIYLAQNNDRIIGSAALIKEGEGVYELAKMTVVPDWRGKGISKLLIEVCLNKARALGARKVSLFSNDQLQTALQLYRTYGFTDVPVTDSPFTTANVKMELSL